MFIRLILKSWSKCFNTSASAAICNALHHLSFAVTILLKCLMFWLVSSLRVSMRVGKPEPLSILA